MGRFRVICVGGTIDKVYFDALSRYQVGEPQVSAVFRSADVSVEYEIVSVMRKDSLEMTDVDRQRLCDMVAASPERRILVTHGTDTMVESAADLRRVQGKVVVLTGAMTPAKFHDTDATFNIGFAMGALSVLNEGVYVCMNGRVFPAGSVQKNRAEGRFESYDATAEGP